MGEPGGNSLIALLVYGKITAKAAAAYSTGLSAQQRSATAVSEARGEIRQLLESRGSVYGSTCRTCRAVRNAMTEYAGFADLAHAFDLKSSALAARATLECALERRETRGCHNRSDYPEADVALQVNLVRSGPGHIVREPIATAPQEISHRMHDVSQAGKLVE